MIINKNLSGAKKKKSKFTVGEKKNQNPCVQITLVRLISKSLQVQMKKKSKVQRNQIILTSVELIDQSMNRSS